MPKKTTKTMQAHANADVQDVDRWCDTAAAAEERGFYLDDEYRDLKNFWDLWCGYCRRSHRLCRRHKTPSIYAMVWTSTTRMDVTPLASILASVADA